jgi:aminoglycoside phosphotransferase (APT) family kinase protein
MTFSPRHIALAEDIVRRFQDIESHLARPPHCLCHGDVKSDNLFFDASTMPYFIDWQYVSLGKGAQDVVFFMIESFSTGFMREHVDELKDQYFQALTSTTERSRIDSEADFVHAAQYFPFFVAMWFGTTPEHDLVDASFPQRFLQKLFGFYDTIGL